MSQYELDNEKFVLPSPAGVYYATASNQSDLSRGLLLALMTQVDSQPLTKEKLINWLSIDCIETTFELLHKIQQLGWLASSQEKQSAPAGALEEIIPPLLAVLSSSSKALLADQQGFNLASSGFTHEAAEELSALSADFVSLRMRHGTLLFNNLNIKTQAMGLIDAAGNSQLGFWPLYIGKHCFTLVMSGIPQFNQPAFTNLVWLLTNRYAANDFTATSSVYELFSQPGPDEDTNTDK
ncbi:MAG TPA: hypothetical protein ENJ13_05385 [Chromatiales bacterium]|nr:hypothetical protein [Chromatiales bacterium]